jgi:6,7-dimethyl-8-ribityllumazine synthase
MRANLDPKPRNGAIRADGLRFGIVVSRFNSLITEKLLGGALDALKSAGAKKNQVEILHVPGAFEIPLAAKKLAETGRVHAIIAIGCVIRGETTHYDYIASEVSRGIQLAQLDTGVPIIFCVLTCETLEQAKARAGFGAQNHASNKGYDAGLAAVEMGNLARKMSSRAKLSSSTHRRRK